MEAQIITISREYGSGGRIIGELVAEKLGYAFYDKELVDEIFKKSGFAKEFIAEGGEYAFSKNNFLFNLGNARLSEYDFGYSISDRLYTIQQNIIKDIANKKPCVIVGRNADYVLKDKKNCLNVFIHCDIKTRIDRAINDYGEETKKIEKKLRDKDEKRKIYYKNYTDRIWGMSKNYNLCLDSGYYGIERCANIIIENINRHF
ncbi:MAG: cytidylate kinase-like family protein [Bacteroidetes bacterium]|nr:cytidylate kinase-like family protein [Bacteroidota bacterium]